MAAARETLKAAPRTEFGSRTSRRLRRQGFVPGVVYAGGSEARPFQVAEREVRHVLSGGQALLIYASAAQICSSLSIVPNAGMLFL